MAVLVLTQRLDPTADLVVSELNRRNVVVFRCDTADFPHELTLAAHLQGSRWVGELRNGVRCVALEAISAAYYRRPTRFRFPGLTDAEAAWAEQEAVYGLGGVLATLPCRWLSHPHRIALANFKPLQLTVAAEVGLSVPSTLVTNDPLAAESFAKTSTVYKTLGGPPKLDHQPHSLYTSEVTERECADPSIRGTAHQFQRWIQKAYEVRLTVVGGRCFAAAIHAGSAAAELDWRSDYNSLTYSVVALSSDIEDRAVALVERLGLGFGCLDFVVTPQGEHVFLEINPNGQWAWIEHATGLPIAAAIADYLEGCPS